MMSRQGSREHAPGESADVLDVIREEISPTVSVVKVPLAKPINKKLYSSCCECCVCQEIKKPSIEVEVVEKLLKEKEEELISEHNERLNKEISLLKERADFILQNEQVRASYMLREAHRERQEKIDALQTQLECKNLAGLMYVMCSEKKRSKMEKMVLVEEYTNYIIALQEILAEAQTLILNLSRGYKTAARVDSEWRQKMKKTLLEFQTFVQHFMKGTPESNQFFFDLPKLLKTESPIIDNPKEDPCTCVEEETVEEEAEIEPEEPWYERVEEDCRPFIIFGDMADFKPPQRREVLRAQKKIKTAPRKWKEYVFHDMFVNAECSNADAIKDKYPDVPTIPTNWACPITQDAMMRQSLRPTPATQAGPGVRRTTAQSIDMRGGMGSILKIMTTSNAYQPVLKTSTKAMILGARDSMEIVSTTKLREKHKQSTEFVAPAPVVLNVGSRRTSILDDPLDIEDDNSSKKSPELDSNKPEVPRSSKEDEAKDEDDESASLLGSSHNDSLTKVPHRPDRDHIHYEKICPVEKCQRMQVDSFIRSLPPYMRASPFTHFEQNYDEYVTCSPEQLNILRERIHKKKKKEKADLMEVEVSPLEEWKSIEGVAVQTSDISMSMPDCACRGPNPSEASSNGQIFNVQDLYPMKQILNEINREYFYDDTIQFNRFMVIGEESDETIKHQRDRQQYKKNRLSEVKKVLKQHPSLLDIFQANAV